MSASSRFRACLLVLSVALWLPQAYAVELSGEAIQGGLIFGTTQPGDRVFLDDTEVMVSLDGGFVIGFSRDETGERSLRIEGDSGSKELVALAVAPRE